jgi:hypothetical protein
MERVLDDDNDDDEEEEEEDGRRPGNWHEPWEDIAGAAAPSLSPTPSATDRTAEEQQTAEGTQGGGCASPEYPAGYSGSV